jgi:hypothetical protein
MKKRYTPTIVLLVMALMVIGCGSAELLTPTIAPSPTEAPTETSTSSPTATLTPVPTDTPTPTLDLTATAVWEVASLEQAAIEFCKDHKALPGSAEYIPGSPLTPILVCDEYSCEPLSSLLAESIGLDLAPWTPSRNADIQLVLCENTSRQSKWATGLYCNYSNATSSKSLPTYQVVNFYELYVASTGARLNSFQIPGKLPVYCWSTIGGYETEILGDPDDAALFKQLAVYLKIQIPTPTPFVYTLQCNIDGNLDNGNFSGVEGYTILGEVWDPTNNKVTNRGSRVDETTASGKITKVTITVDRTVFYAISGHTYHITGTIIVSTNDPKLTYDITATGNAFTVNPQTCKKP